jgi:hypothetical protein
VEGYREMEGRSGARKTELVLCAPTKALIQRPHANDNPTWLNASKQARKKKEKGRKRGPVCDPSAHIREAPSRIIHTH